MVNRMKKAFLIIFLFCLYPSITHAYSAESMVAIDLSSGRVLYEQNARKEKLIASTTKIMTTVIALEQMDLDQEITVDEEVLKAYGSAIYIEVGEKLTLRDLLYGLMLRSGNDAAVVIAKAVGGSKEGFAYLMNQKAYEIGMSQTVFYNSHGLEENDGNGNTSTAYDMALLMRYAMNNPEFRLITSAKNYVGKSDKKTYHWANKNKLLQTYEYTIGGKTGFTEKARRTLVTAASKEGREIAIVTLNDGNDFEDHKNLYDVLFSQFSLVNVFAKDNFEIPNLKRYLDDDLYIDKDVSVLLTKEEEEKLNVNYEMYELDSYETGDVVGIAHICLDNQELRAIKIYVSKKSTQEIGFFRKILGWIFQW